MKVALDFVEFDLTEEERVAITELVTQAGKAIGTEKSSWRFIPGTAEIPMARLDICMFFTDIDRWNLAASTPTSFEKCALHVERARASLDLWHKRKLAEWGGPKEAKPNMITRKL
jgi:hypothetical protein